MKASMKFSPEVQERAERMVAEAQGQHDSLWAAIVSIAAKIGCTPETLHRWVSQAQPRQQAARGADDDRGAVHPGCWSAKWRAFTIPGAVQADCDARLPRRYRQ